MQNRLQPVLPATLHYHGSAGVEIYIQIFCLSRADREASACNLPGWNFDSGLRLRRKLQRLGRVGRIAGQHQAVGDVAALIVIYAGTVRRQNKANLLVSYRLAVGRAQEGEKTMG